MVKHDYRKLAQELAIATGIATLIAPVLTALSVLWIMMEAADHTDSFSAKLLSVAYPWMWLVGSNDYFYIPLALQFFAYAWAWALVRFFSRKASTANYLLLGIHVIGCLILWISTW